MSDALPEPYNRWITELVGEPPQAEAPSSCADCVMCPTSRGAIAGVSTFSPNAKCCTYLPDLANFLVGKALISGDPVAVKSVRARMASGPDATPMGLWRDAAKTTLYDNDPQYMGKAELACPHYLVDGGTCAIWSSRNAVCSTWFCRHERGARGHRRWMAVRALLNAMEADLAAWCALELGIPADTVARFGRAATHTVSHQAADREWGAWSSDREAFYVGCWDRVRDLSLQEVMSVCGPLVRAVAEQATSAAGALSDGAVPDHLALGAFTLRGMSAGGHLAATFSPFDPVYLPAMLFAVLHYFDGRPTPEALEAMVEERGMSIDAELMRHLLDYGVLVGVNAPTP